MMTTVKFRRYYDMQERRLSVDIFTGITLSNVKRLIGDNIGVSPYHLDIIQNCKIRGSSDVIDTSDMIDVIVHPERRVASFIYRTNDPDCMTYEMDDHRVKMSCGHAFTPDNLYSYCLSLLNDKRTNFQCPCCRVDWPFKEVVGKACLSNDERCYFEQRINLNVTDKEGNCPMCYAYCTRLVPGNPKVECLYCKRNGSLVYTFCWSCCQTWIGRHICPNVNQALQNQLQNCERITMPYNNMTNVPKVRACPHCTNMIEHNGGCKTMTCKSCRKIFCFCCLKPAVNGALQCGNERVVCTLAPVQKI